MARSSRAASRVAATAVMIRLRILSAFSNFTVSIFSTQDTEIRWGGAEMGLDGLKIRLGVIFEEGIHIAPDFLEDSLFLLPGAGKITFDLPIIVLQQRPVTITHLPIPLFL